MYPEIIQGAIKLKSQSSQSKPLIGLVQGNIAYTLLAEVNSPLIKSTLLSMFGASISMLVFPSLLSFLRYNDIEKKVISLNVGEIQETSNSASILLLSALLLIGNQKQINGLIISLDVISICFFICLRTLAT